MRWSLIGEGGGTAVACLFAFRLTRHQKGHVAGQAVNLAPLCGDDIGQIVDGPRQVGDAFFQSL